jgi:actin-like ATPase involved in cell morphogenesis
MEIRAFYVSVFASRLDREDGKILRRRVDGRNRLAELKARLDKTPQDQSLQMNLASYLNGLRFPHWFLPNIDAFTDEFIEDADIYFGESVWFHLSRIGTQKARAAVQRIKAPSGPRDILGLEFKYLDEEKDKLIPDQIPSLFEDLRIVKIVMRWMRNRFHNIGRMAAGEKDYCVMGVPPGAPPLTKALLFMIGLEAGYDAVILRAEPELVARSLILPAEKACIVIDIGAGTTDVCVFIPVSGTTILDPRLQETVQKASFAVDRQVEELIRNAIETQHPRGTKFYWPQLPQEHLSYWKESCSQPQWEQLKATKENHDTFLYQYKANDEIKFFDVSSVLSADLVGKAFDKVLTQDIKEKVKSTLDPQGKQPDTEKLLAIHGGPAAQRTVIGGGGSQIPNIQETLKQALGPNHRVRIVPDHLNSVADGARFFARTVWDEDWKEIEQLQKGWLDKHRIEDPKHIDEWYRAWRNIMQDARIRERLRYNMSY